MSHVFDYRKKSDDELGELSAERTQLLPDAQHALQEELDRRHITSEDIKRVQ